MSFPVAVQSAIFYFLACTPCVAARARYRTRQNSKREREERARAGADDEDPNLYRHPGPFNMNPYWEEELAMGPRLPKKGKAAAAAAGSKNTSQRKLTSAGKDSCSGGTRSSLAISNGTSEANTPGSPTLVPEDTMSLSVERSTTASSGDGWNHKRYQREDEELWGHEQSRRHRLVDAIVKAGSSAGRLLESKLGIEKDKQVTDEDRANFYRAPIHPPVNDYHPPVATSKPTNRDALKWMLQPPPPAKVMEGKVPVRRSASMTSSLGRRTTVGSNISLERRLGERMVEAKLRKGETPVESDVLPLPSPGRSASRKSAASPRTRSRRSGSLSTESDGSTESAPRRRRRKTGRPAVTPEVESAEEEDGGYFRPIPEPRAAAQRPKLETILSSDASSRVDSGSHEGKENISLAKQLHDDASRRDAHHEEASPVKERSTGASIDSGLALST